MILRNIQICNIFMNLLKFYDHVDKKIKNIYKKILKSLKWKKEFIKVISLSENL